MPVGGRDEEIGIVFGEHLLVASEHAIAAVR
jgi:hypothetical protein